MSHIHPNMMHNETCQRHFCLSRIITCAATTGITGSPQIEVESLIAVAVLFEPLQASHVR